MSLWSVTWLMKVTYVVEADDEEEAEIAACELPLGQFDSMTAAIDGQDTTPIKIEEVAA